MYISELKLWNFRQFGKEGFDIESPDFEVNFNNGLNVIVGENDSGKTTIIDALRLILKTHSQEFYPLDIERDFYGNSAKLRIEVKIEGFESIEAKNFTEWLEFDEDSKKPFLKLFIESTHNNFKIQTPDVRVGVGEGSFLDFAAREYLKVTYLKPLRDAENDLAAKKNSRLSQILMGDNLFKEADESHALVNLFKDLKFGIDKYFSKGEDGEVIKNNIDGYLGGFFGDNKKVSLDNNADQLQIKQVLEKLSLLLSQGKNYGLGTLNRLSMAAELLHLNQADWSGLRVTLIEELEAHLHPQAQMQVIESLQNEIENSKLQMILTSHSPNLTSKVNLENIIICRNKKAFPLSSNYTKLNEKNYQYLEKFLDVTKSNLFFAEALIFVEGWSEEILIPSLSKSLGFNFTKQQISIINIAGIGFEHFMKIFDRKNDPQLDINVAIITDCDMAPYKLVKLKLEREPTNEELTQQTSLEEDVVVDVVSANEELTQKVTKEEEVGKEDERHGEEEEEEEEKLIFKNLDQNKIKNKIEAFKQKSSTNIVYFIGQPWTLEYCLLQSTALKDIFIEVLKEVHPRSDWSNPEEELVRKLLKKTLNKTKVAYNLAFKLEHVELILEAETVAEPETVVSKIVIKRDDSIYYLVEAIKHVTK